MIGFTTRALAVILCLLSQGARAAEAGVTRTSVLIIDTNALRAGPFQYKQNLHDVTDAWIKGIGVRAGCPWADYCDKLTDIYLLPARPGLGAEQPVDVPEHASIRLPKDIEAPYESLFAAVASGGMTTTFAELAVARPSRPPDVIVFIGIEGEECAQGCAAGVLSAAALQKIAETTSGSADFFLNPRMVVLMSPSQLSRESPDRISDPDQALEEWVSGKVANPSAGGERLESILRNLDRRKASGIWSEIFPNAAILGFEGAEVLKANAETLRSISSTIAARLSALKFQLGKPDQASAPGNTPFFQDIAEEWNRQGLGARSVLPMAAALKRTLTVRPAALDSAKRVHLLLEALHAITDHRPQAWVEAIPVAKRASLHGLISHLIVATDLRDTARSVADGTADSEEVFLALLSLYGLPGFDEAAEAALKASGPEIRVPEAATSKMIVAAQQLLGAQDLAPLRFAIETAGAWIAGHPELLGPVSARLADSRDEVRVAVLGTLGQVLRDLGYSAQTEDATDRKRRSLETIAKIGDSLSVASEDVRRAAIQSLAQIAERREGGPDDALGLNDHYLAEPEHKVCGIVTPLLPKLESGDEDAIRAATDLVRTLTCPQ